MPRAKETKRLRLEDPATYRICVQGYLDDTWSERLANMSISIDAKEGQVPVSTLVGETRDQAELIGVLNGLYELRLPILSLEILNGS